jgi:hypothetical protein
MPRRIYVGPIDAIITNLGIDPLQQRQWRVERGEAVDVTEEQAALLDQQPDNWAKPRTEVKEQPAPVPSPASPTEKEGD